MKVYVRVRQMLDAPVLKRTVDKDGKTVTVWKSKGKSQPSWKLQITSIQPKKTLFGTKLYVDAYPYAEKTITYHHDTETIEEPHWNKQASKRFIEAEMVKKTGEKVDEKSNTGIWIVAILVIASIVVNFLISRGLR